MRRVLLWGGAVVLALLLVAALALVWLLNSAGGRDFALARAVAALPPGALQWERAEGSLAGRTVLVGVRYLSEDGLEVRAGRVELDARVPALLGRRVEVRQLWLDDVDVRLAPPGEAPSEPTGWPESLPSLDLPLAIELHELRVRGLRLLDAERLPLLLVDRIDLGGELREGRVALQPLQVLSDRGDLFLEGTLDSGQGYASDISGSLQLPAPEGSAAAAGPRLDLRISGDLDNLALAVDGEVPEPLSLRATLREGAGETPLWTLGLQAQGLDPSLFGVEDSEIIAATLTASGEGTLADLQGRVERDGLTLVLAPSQLHWDQGTLHMQPLRVDAFEGSVSIEGSAGLAGEDTSLDVRARLAGIRYQPAPEQPVLAADGELALQGTLDAWRLEGDISLERDGEQARVVLSGPGDRESLTLDSFRADVPGGRLLGSGRVAWAPALAWEVDAALEAFDPGYFVPDYPGRIDARILSQGGVDDTGTLAAQVRVEGISGQLRERALSGQAALDWRGEGGSAELDLGIGRSRLSGGGQVGDRLDLDLLLDPLQLQDLLPDASGVIVGRIGIAGNPDAPDIVADLQGRELRLDGTEVEALRVQGELPGSGQRGALQASLSALVVGGMALEQVEVQVAGSLADADVSLQARGDPGALEVSAAVQRAGDVTTGRLQALRYAPPRGAAWSLEAPAEFRQQGADIVLEPACLGAGAAQVCLEADWPRSASVDGRGLPMAMLEPWLAEDGLDFHVEGTVSLQGRIEQAGDSRSGRAQLRSEGIVVRLAEGAARELLSIQRLVLDAELEGEALSAELDVRMAGDDYIRGALASALGEDAPLDASLELSVDDLTFVELFSPDVLDPQGHLGGRLSIGGTVAAPVISGSAGLERFGAELPALGITLRDSDLRLRGDASGAAMLEGRLDSGQGHIMLSGRMSGVADGARRIEIDLEGTDFLAADLPELRATVSPQIQVVVLEERLQVRGRVDVPSARIDLERLETTTSPSRDVVVLDPVDPDRGTQLPIDALVTVSLGEGVELIGFGLEGALAGQLRVREVTGRETTATGALEVSGEYTAYGQDLNIERGRLAWASSAIANPSLDIVAQRRINEITVGIRVRGTAIQPTTEIYSEPAMDTTEALSWLVLGRPLQSADSDEGQQLGAAALALGAGGNLIAEQLGSRLGLDEAGVSESRALGGATFSVGKYLSPRLLVSYGVSLLGSGQVLTLKYLLDRGFDIEIESGTESRVNLNWRLER